MSHMVETLAFAGELPWHGLGTRLPERADAQAMLQDAGLDWTVEARPAYTGFTAEGAESEEDMDFASIPGYKAIVRFPHGNVLSIQSDEYGIVQNREVADLAEAMSGEGVRAWEVGGSLDDGRKVFLCGVLDEGTIAGDVVRQYMTVASSHDGSLSVTAAFSPVRVVCANTLAMFVDAAEGRNRITVRHTKNAAAKVKLAGALCTQARAYFGAFNAQALALVGAAMSVVDAEETAAKLFPAYKNDEGKLVVPDLQEKLVAIFKALAAVPHDRHLAGTKWGFVQALTATLDHNRRGSQRSKLARFLTGTDDSLRSRAVRLLLGK